MRASKKARRKRSAPRLRAQGAVVASQAGGAMARVIEESAQGREGPAPRRGAAQAGGTPFSGDPPPRRRGGDHIGASEDAAALKAALKAGAALNAAKAAASEAERQRLQAKADAAAAAAVEARRAQQAGRN